MKIKNRGKKIVLGTFLVGTAALLTACSIDKTNFNFNIKNIDSNQIIGMVQSALNDQQPSNSFLKIDNNKGIKCNDISNKTFNYMCSEGHYDYKQIKGIYWTNDITSNSGQDSKYDSIYHFDQQVDASTLDMSSNQEQTSNEFNKTQFDYTSFIGTQSGTKDLDNPFFNKSPKQQSSTVSPLRLLLWFTFIGKDDKFHYIAAMTSFHYNTIDKDKNEGLIQLSFDFFPAT
ncbi:MAG: hypothetical protein ACRAS9_01195 [Mycoplasma sp.]